MSVTFLPSDPCLVLVTGKTNVKDDELDAMLKEASGPINFTMFLNMFGAKLMGENHGVGSTMEPGFSLVRGSLQAGLPKQSMFCWLLTLRSPGISHKNPNFPIC